MLLSDDHLAVQDAILAVSAAMTRAGEAVDADRLFGYMLDTDKGGRFLGELGIGVNYGIQKFTKDILFDEKIGGTVHLAVVDPGVGTARRISAPSPS